MKEVIWISREQDRLDLCAESFKAKIGKKISFKKCMEKIKISTNSTMKRRKKIRPGGKKELRLRAAEWVDEELIENIKLRSKFNKEWRYARKRNEPEEVIQKYKQRYLEQKSKTALMTGDKKSAWECKKINETWKDSKTFWRMIKELLGKGKEITDEAFIFTNKETNKKL